MKPLLQRIELVLVEASKYLGRGGNGSFDAQREQFLHAIEQRVDFMAIELALQEAVANGIRHGCRGDLRQLAMELRPAVGRDGRACGRGACHQERDGDSP